jgi:hypothetical protein
MPNEYKSTGKRLLVYAIVGLLLLCGGAAYGVGKHYLAKPVGTECASETSCRGASVWALWAPGMCLTAGSSHCTHECATAQDCPGQYSCEQVEGPFTSTTRNSRGSARRSVHNGTKALCVKKE